MESEMKSFGLIEVSGYFRFLDQLRSDGIYNMATAPTELRKEFDLGEDAAHLVAKAWRDTFSETSAYARAGVAMTTVLRVGKGE